MLVARPERPLAAASVVPPVNAGRTASAARRERQVARAVAVGQGKRVATVFAVPQVRYVATAHAVWRRTVAMELVARLDRAAAVGNVLPKGRHGRGSHGAASLLRRRSCVLVQQGKPAALFVQANYVRLTGIASRIPRLLHHLHVRHARVVTAPGSQVVSAADKVVGMAPPVADLRLRSPVACLTVLRVTG